jgi:hypothetical protein
VLVPIQIGTALPDIRIRPPRNSGSSGPGAAAAETERRHLVTAARTKAGLSANCRRLVETIEQLGYGRIEGIRFAEGEPEWSPPPRVIREVKLHDQHTPRYPQQHGNYELKAQFLALVRHMEDAGEGVIRTLEVKDGLPFKACTERKVPM